MYKKLIINGQEVDLDKRPKVNVSYEVKDGETIKTGASKQSISLPATHRNLNAFGLIDLVSVDASTLRKKLPFSYSVDGVQYLHGICELTQATARRGSTDSINVNLYIQSIEWFDGIGDALLNELDFDDMFYTYVGVTDGFNNNSGQDDTCFFVCKSKQWTDPTLTDGVYPQDCTPALFLRRVLVKMFEAIGYTLESTFFSDQSKGGGLIMPFIIPERLSEQYSQDYINAEESQSSSDAFNANNTYEAVPFDTFVNPNIGTPFNGTGVYTAPKAGFYEFSGVVEVSDIETSASVLNLCTFVLEFTQSVGTSGGVALGIVLNSVGVGASKTFTYTNVLELDAGETVTTRIKGDGLNLVGYTPSYQVIEQRIDGEAIIEFPDTIPVKYVLDPTIKQADILRDLTRVFGLVVTADVSTRTVSIEPARDLYSGVVDWTAKVDTEQNTTLNLTSIKARSKVLRYKTDDATVQDVEERQEDAILQTVFDRGENFANKTDVHETEFFASTLMRYSTDIKADTNDDITPCIPVIYNGNYLDGDTATSNLETASPRLLWFGGQRGGLDGYINAYNPATSSSVKAPCPACWTVNYNDKVGDSFSLSFADVVRNNVTIKGLTNKYRLRELARERLSKTIKTNVFLTIVDVLNLDFTKRVRIGNDIYILDKIDGYDPTTPTSTKAELTYYQTPTADDVSNIRHTKTNGLIID